MNWTVVGHDRQKEYIERLIERAVLGHAYLLTGPDMVGKRMVVQDVVRHLMPDGEGLDVFRLSPEFDEEGKRHAIDIESVRQLKNWISLRPTGTRKIVLIDDADWMVGDAANTMLKILEEPPSYAHFFLVTSRPGAILPTIASRCERLDFRILDEDQMKTVLEGIKLDADDRALVASIAAGRPGLVLRLVNEKKLPVVAKAIADLATLLKGGIAEKIAYAKKLADTQDAPEVISWWLAYVHSRLAAKPHLAPVASGLLDLTNVMAEPQFNRRLAIEHFLLTNSVQ